MTVDLARGLIARGHDVRVFCRPDSDLQNVIGGEIPHDSILYGMNLFSACDSAVRAFRRHRTIFS